jgi:predicted pyridoxine 5'-phosphate oxidase superfamily flavin-nucleotide-binding protein
MARALHWPPAMRDVFHRGEKSVQEKAGVRERAAKVGRIVDTAVGGDAAGFLEQQAFVVLASMDALGRPWASPMTGEPGIVTVEDPSTITLTGLIGASDPLRENLVTPGPLALLAIDLSTRSRYRVNGTAEAVSHDRIRLSVREAFGNCPKYIQVRHLEPARGAAPVRVGDAPALGADQRRFIEAADTFFIATHADGGADASHRGGRPGFVTVEPDGTLVIPDYTGNNMFQTLGNIELAPVAGLLFLDFETGRALQLTGTASIDWDEGHAAAFAGARRLLRFVPVRVVETRGALAVRGGLIEPSPFNP